MTDERKICVVGAGAIGGLLGARLAQAGESVTLIARGAHLRAIERDGLAVIGVDGGRTLVRPARATADMPGCGVQDLVVLALKAHQLEPVIDDICSLIGPRTTVLTTQNGIPWWYFQCHGGPYEGTVIHAVDPHGTLSSRIDPGQLLACIPYPAAEIAAPGVIRHSEGHRFPLGELDGSVSDRAQRISALLTRAGFKAPVLEDIRAELWLKAWGNLSLNPLSALTHATLGEICTYPPVRELAAEMMREAQEIAGRLGITFRVTLEKRIEGAARIGDHKTSMLQDVEAGKALETDALIGAVAELGRLTAVATPHIDAVHACVTLLSKTLTEHRARLQAQPIDG